MNPIQQFFAHIVHLFQKKLPSLEEMIQPEVDLLKSILVKFAAVDLSTTANTVVSSMTAGAPFGAAVANGAQALKAQVVAQAIEATEEELQIIATSVAKTQAKNINVAVAAAQAGEQPKPAVSAEAGAAAG